MATQPNSAVHLVFDITVVAGLQKWEAKLGLLDTFLEPSGELRWAWAEDLFKGFKKS